MLTRNRGIRGSEVFCVSWEEPEVPFPATELGQSNRNLDRCIRAMEDILDMTISSLSRRVKTLHYKVFSVDPFHFHTHQYRLPRQYSDPVS